jgi:hypothetical protein
MGKREAFDCDRCKIKDVMNPTRIIVTTDRVVDAAGSMEDVVDEVVLCKSCTAMLFNKLVQEVIYVNSLAKQINSCKSAYTKAQTMAEWMRTK